MPVKPHFKSSRKIGLSIGELARRSGVAPSAIRYYERTGVLSQAERLSGRRIYSVEDVARLKLVATVRRLGVSIAVLRQWRGQPETLLRQEASGLAAALKAEAAESLRAAEHLESLAGCACKAWSACPELGVLQ